MSDGSLFIVSAPSGGGKTSLTRALLARSEARGVATCVSVSYTTRAPRVGEQDGVHYHFVDEAQFVSMIEQGAFLEHAHVFGRRYGTGREATEQLLASGKDVILDIDWQGAQQVRGNRPETLSIFILPPSRAELERRLRQRGQDDEATVLQRMAEARDEMSHYSEYDFVLVNDQFERALDELEAIFIEARTGWTARTDKLRTPAQAAAHRALISALLAN
ncbi:MAG: guanylate kinase [Nevskiales bacterium]|nr:guanylate kinase [Nevskiales bacterium]